MEMYEICQISRYIMGIEILHTANQHFSFSFPLKMVGMVELVKPILLAIVWTLLSSMCCLMILSFISVSFAPLCFLVEDA